MNDWLDDGWEDFADRFLDDQTSAQVRLLKEAWLHGARTALAHSREIVNEHVQESVTR